MHIKKVLVDLLLVTGILFGITGVNSADAATTSMNTVVSDSTLSSSSDTFQNNTRTTTQNRSFTVELSSMQTGEIQVGDHFKLTSIFTPALPSYVKMAFRSTNPNVATVDSNGLITVRSFGTVEIQTYISDPLLSEEYNNSGVAGVGFTVQKPQQDSVTAVSSVQSEESGSAVSEDSENLSSLTSSDGNQQHSAVATQNNN